MNLFQIVTDPKQALQKTQELWAYLSENEPENQARPETMEQLLVLLTRETARRMVHFINYTRNAVVRFPETLRKTQYEMMHQLIKVTKCLAQLIRTRPISTRLGQEVTAFQDRISSLYDEVQNYATNRLVNMAVGDQSMALVPYNPHHHQPARTNNFSCTPNNEYHLTFHCSIHYVCSAVRRLLTLGSSREGFTD